MSPSPVSSASVQADAIAAPEGRPYHELRGLLWLVAAAFFMQTLDSTIVNTAVPAMAQALHETPLGMRTALTSYVLTLAVLIPASPWLCDRFGTRRVFAVAIGVFGIGSLLCGLAQSLPQLVAARVLQGMGGAALMPVGRYVLVRTVARRDFVRAMSTVATVGLLGSVLGPMLGGALVQYTSWRLIFLMNVPVALLGWWLNRASMPDYRLDRANRFDKLGFVMFASASALLLAAAEQAGGRSQTHWATVGVFGGLGLLLGGLYVWHSRRVDYPVADLSLLRVRSVSVAITAGLFTRLGIAGMFLLLVLFLQVGCGWSPLAAGLMMVPQALGAISAKWLINRLLLTLGYRRLLLINTLIVASVLASFSLIGNATPVWLIAGMVFFYGAFMGLQFTALNTLVYTDLDVRHASMASSMASTAQYLSMSFGIALASLLMELFIDHSKTMAAAYVSAFHIAVLLLALITAIAALVFLRLQSNAGEPTT